MRTSKTMIDIAGLRIMLDRLAAARDFSNISNDLKA
jgi:hypothetical protein